MNQLKSVYNSPFKDLHSHVFRLLLVMSHFSHISCYLLVNTLSQSIEICLNLEIMGSSPNKNELSQVILLGWQAQCRNISKSLLCPDVKKILTQVLQRSSMRIFLKLYFQISGNNQ